MTDWEPWQSAWYAALYGENGFYLRPEGPAGHFRTASHAAPEQLAIAISNLARERGCTSIVDVGAGRGELLRAIASATPGRTNAGQLNLHGVDVVPRPYELPAGITWWEGIAAVGSSAFDGALVIGWELLDVVPCTVLEVDADGTAREVLVQPPTGSERLGPPVRGPLG